MRAGKLDASITIQSATYTTEPSGSQTVVWSDFAILRAEIVQSGTEQFFRAYGAVEEAQTIFRTRYVAGVETTHRILFGEATYRITKINEIRRKRGFEITAVT